MSTGCGGVRQEVSADMESETPLIRAASAGGFLSASGKTNRPHSFFMVKSTLYFTFFMYLLLVFASNIDLVFVDTSYILFK